MAVKVLKRFQDKNTGEVYTPNKPYVADASEERIQELVDKGFLAADEDKRKANEDDGEPKPKHVGGGVYELPDGTRVKGKEEAIAAMKA